MGRSTIAAAVAQYALTLYRTAKWAYNHPSILVTSSGIILASAKGVRQRDPLALLLFSLAIRPMLEHLQQTLPSATIIAYLDDIYVLSPENTPSMPTIAKAFENSLIALNAKKSLEERVPRLQEIGLKALGTFLGPKTYRRKFLQGKINELKAAFEAIRNLPK